MYNLDLLLTPCHTTLLSLLIYLDYKEWCLYYLKSKHLLNIFSLNSLFFQVPIFYFFEPEHALDLSLTPCRSILSPLDIYLDLEEHCLLDISY